LLTNDNFHYQLGKLYYAEGDVEQAYRHVLEAAEIAARDKNQAGLGKYHPLLGELTLALKKIGRA
jgi:hypothetical protein